MVPGWYQSGTRVPPVKCQGKTGPGRCFCHSKCLCCSGGRSRGGASARALFSSVSRKCLGSLGRSPSRKSAGPSHPKPLTSHLQAICKPTASHSHASFMRPSCVPHASLMRPPCYHQATLDIGEMEATKEGKPASEARFQPRSQEVEAFASRGWMTFFADSLSIRAAVPRLAES
jgi:hypothetical protein